MQNIKKGDEVIVIAGRSKGKRGNVLKRLDENRLLVENVNMVKKHLRVIPVQVKLAVLLSKRRQFSNQRDAV